MEVTGYARARGRRSCVTCVVCRVAPCNVTLVACGHGVLCRTCLAAMRAAGPARCPLCRVPIVRGGATVRAPAAEFSAAAINPRVASRAAEAQAAADAEAAAEAAFLASIRDEEESDSESDFQDLDDDWEMPCAEACYRFNRAVAGQRADVEEIHLSPGDTGANLFFRAMESSNDLVWLSLDTQWLTACSAAALKDLLLRSSSIEHLTLGVMEGRPPLGPAGHAAAEALALGSRLSSLFFFGADADTVSAVLLAARTAAQLKNLVLVRCEFGATQAEQLETLLAHKGALQCIRVDTCKGLGMNGKVRRRVAVCIQHVCREPRAYPPPSAP